MRPVRRRMTGALLAATVVLVITLGAIPSSRAVTQTNVASASAAIQSAFVSTYQAEVSGGNVTSLIAALNSATQLVEKAQAENSTSPVQASSDLQTARLLAQNVTDESAAVSAAGNSLKQFVLVRSVVSATAILVAAALVYVYGGRMSRLLWVKIYGGYVVRPANG